MELESFAEQVKVIRMRLGLSQEEFAHKVSVSFTTVNRWENGKTKPSKLAQKQITLLVSDSDRERENI